MNLIEQLMQESRKLTQSERKRANESKKLKRRVNESLSDDMRERIEDAVMNFDDDAFITDDRAWLDADALVEEMASEVIYQLYKDSLDYMTNDEAISYAEKVFWDKSSMSE